MDKQETGQDSAYGDFEEIEDETKKTNANEQPQQNFPVRVRLPRDRQLIGIVLERLGGKRMSIKATDGKIRNCRVPGRFSRKFWLRPGHFVMIEPWPDDDDKGDIVYQYRPNEITQLKKKGLVNNLDRVF
ncbi:MAG: translation initiation factor IF-1A [Nanoarchaeota archaeon]|nr:translation initiation factor IF-1A [Nanoarchaeota archaeon]MBU0977617.1 translation initiation factor IF-1A [Nanoarchaeota archaeon]